MDTALDELAALREGRAFTRPRARAIAVRGEDAERWLNDLVTAGVAGLEAGMSVRSLVLTPTGRIRADVDVLRTDEGFLLVQDSDQPDPVEAVLGPYVLSSAVELARSGATPVRVPTDRAWRVAVDVPVGAVEIGAAAFDRWRIESGIARFPTDIDPDSLPAEAGLDVPPVIDTAKGCFLGQEAVARVRNLGHPTRVVHAFEADAAVAVGVAVLTGEAQTGVVTSSVEVPVGRSIGLARIRWDAREAALHTADGVDLRPR